MRVAVDVGGTQPRTVLAMLLVAGGRVVPAESIIEALWGHDPPDSAAGTLVTVSPQSSRTRCQVTAPATTRASATSPLTHARLLIPAA